MRSLQIARGEIEETRYFCILARDLNFIAVADFEEVSARCDAVGKLINTLSRSLREKLGAGTARLQ